MANVSKSICIYFSTSDSWISRAVRWFTQSEVSHTFITFKDHLLDQAMVLEVGWRGLRLIPWEEWVMNNRLIARFSVSVPEAQQVEAINKQIRYLGTGYNYLYLLAMMFRRFRKWSKNPFASSRRMICSEAVSIFLNMCGAARIKRPDQITPKILYHFVCENPQMFIRKE